ncbi:MAG: TlpA family protein disulfide reductase [Gammaproteobacteria bacterium]|nr:TlpA family protein disulfide reductase [Gammaproteobacteria bacterium]MYD81318.1 TlpA family protein disulfide reductase [Gammaproteobacteria bacterium]
MKYMVAKSRCLISVAIALAGLAIFLCSCTHQMVIPTEQAAGCDHVSLDEILPGIGSDIPLKPYRREQYRNDKQFIRGQKAPNFTLADLEGNNVSLFDVLDENDTVLVDFWTVTCGPCIASFPKLKELRAKYKPQGFEVVSISIDLVREDWISGSEEYELPWINLGELESFYGEVATEYGVRFIPKSYLIDKEGCLLQKDLTTDLLEEVLISQYDK